MSSEEGVLEAGQALNWVIGCLLVFLLHEQSSEQNSAYLYTILATNAAFAFYRASLPKPSRRRRQRHTFQLSIEISLVWP